MQEAINMLIKMDLMGATLPRKYGGLWLPSSVFLALTEIASRADASLMNLFGLQGIAETINWFADEEIKDSHIGAHFVRRKGTRQYGIRHRENAGPGHTDSHHRQ